MYYIQANNNNQLHLAASTALNWQINKNLRLNIGANAQTSSNRHFQTMEDMLGATSYHNINTYALGTYAPGSDEIQYDLRNRNGVVNVGDKFGYDYAINVFKANLWTNFSQTIGSLIYTVAARLGTTTMSREGFMQNGLAPKNSYGKSGTAKFLDGGLKLGANIKLCSNLAVNLGFGYEQKAPLASTAFVSPEINNDFVGNLRNEHIFNVEAGINLNTSIVNLTLSGYLYDIQNATEWQNFYFDDINSFSYVSLTGLRKKYLGLEAGARIKLASFLSLKLIGTISDAYNTNNATVRYMNSTKATVTEETCYTENMRESGTPLTATSIGLSFHYGGWYIDVNGNWYDRIYLSYSPFYRYASTLKTRQSVYGDVLDNEGNIREDALAQATGKGGWMLDVSIGKTLYIKKGMLSINLSLTNVLNNRNLVTGGYEQSRSDYTNSGNTRTYVFSKNPMKFYAYGINGMLNLSYKF